MLIYGINPTSKCAFATRWNGEIDGIYQRLTWPDADKCEIFKVSRLDYPVGHALLFDANAELASVEQSSFSIGGSRPIVGLAMMLAIDQGGRHSAVTVSLSLVAGLIQWNGPVTTAKEQSNVDT